MHVILLLVLLFLTEPGITGKSKKKNKKSNYQDGGTDITINYYLFRRSNRNGVRISNEKLPGDFNRSLPTYVIIHGMGSHHNTPCQRAMRNAFLDRNEANVIVPNYTNSSVLYTVLYQEVARRVGNFLNSERVSAQNTRVVGASLGAHVAGVMRRRTGFRPRELYALDPAGPVFEQLPDNQRLNPSSAEYVHAIHTNTAAFGITAPVAHDDIYINGGNNYPCCSGNTCRHAGACDFFVKTIKDGPMRGRLCDSLNQAQTASCRGAPVEAGYVGRRPSGRRISHLQLDRCGPLVRIMPEDVEE